MKIRKLALKNFRLHRDTVIELSDASFVIVRGRNMSGKTSLAQSLSLNLANTTIGLTSDGKGFADKVTQGEKQAVIITEIQGQHLLENTVTLGMTSRTQEAKCLDAPEDSKIVKGFENFLVRYNDALKVALNTDLFSRMDEKAQKALLAKLVLPSRYDFPKDKVDVINALLDAPIDFNGEPFAVIELAYKKLYKERENCNRDVKNFVIPEALPIPKGVDSASLQKELTEAKAKREKLQKERDVAVAKANETEVERAKLQTKIDGLLAKVEDGKKKLTALEKDILPDAEKSALTATAAKAEELAKLRKEHSAYHGGLVLVNEQIDKLRSLMDKGSECPVCEQPIDGPKISSIIEGLKKEIDSTDAELQKLDNKIEAIGDVEDAKESLKKHEQALKDKEELTKSLQETVEEGKKTRAALNALPKTTDAKLPFNDPLADLQAKEDKIVEQLRPVITAEERAADIKKRREQLEKLEAKAKTLNELTKYFDKDGVKAKLIGEHIGSFQAKLYAVMGAWGYQATLANDLSSFDVTTQRGYKGPVKEISGAEEHIFKAAFQCAVSIAAGIKLVVIDEVEELGEDIRQNLYRSIFSLIQEGALEQAILIGYSLDKTVPNPKAPGSKYLYVEDGEVEVLG